MIKALVEKGQSYDAAIEMAGKYVVDSDSYIRYLSIDLIQAIVKKGRIDAAIEIARK